VSKKGRPPSRDVGRGAYVAAPVAARLLGVMPRTVRRWIASGVLAGAREGRSWFVFRVALERRLAAASSAR
jgi:excisionase family DNA binding protein